MSTFRLLPYLLIAGYRYFIGGIPDKWVVPTLYIHTYIYMLIADIATNHIQKLANKWFISENNLSFLCACAIFRYLLLSRGHNHPITALFCSIYVMYFASSMLPTAWLTKCNVYIAMLYCSPSCRHYISARSCLQSTCFLCGIKLVDVINTQCSCFIE